MKRLLALLLTAGCLATTSLQAFAHDDATLDKMKTPHGGQLRMAGAYHFELVLNPNASPDKESAVSVYLTDHGDRKIPGAGVSGTVILLGSKGKITLPLTPAGDNRLGGSGKYQAEPGLKALVTLTFADKRTEQARFTPLAIQADRTTNGSNGSPLHH